MKIFENTLLAVSEIDDRAFDDVAAGKQSFLTRFFEVIDLVGRGRTWYPKIFLLFLSFLQPILQRSGHRKSEDISHDAL